MRKPYGAEIEKEEKKRKEMNMKAHLALTALDELWQTVELSLQIVEK